MPDDTKPEDLTDPASQLENEIEAAVDAAKVVEDPVAKLDSHLKQLEAQIDGAIAGEDVEAIKKYITEGQEIINEETKHVEEKYNYARDYYAEVEKEHAEDDSETQAALKDLELWESYFKNITAFGGEMHEYYKNLLLAYAKKKSERLAEQSTPESVPKTAQELFDAFLKEVSRIEHEDVGGNEAAQQMREQEAQKLLDDLQK